MDEHGGERPVGEPGLLQVSSDSSAAGYLDDAQATALHFRGGWFQSGDIGMLAADGSLTLLGRPADVLNVGGVKVSADEVDAVARGHPDVENACALLIDADGPAPRLAVMVVGTPRDPAGLAARVRARLPITCEIDLIAAASIPRGTMGKVNRQELAHMVADALAGALPDGSGFFPERIGTF